MDSLGGGGGGGGGEEEASPTRSNPAWPYVQQFLQRFIIHKVCSKVS